MSCQVGGNVYLDSLYIAVSGVPGTLLAVLLINLIGPRVLLGECKVCVCVCVLCVCVFCARVCSVCGVVLYMNVGGACKLQS